MKISYKKIRTNIDWGSYEEFVSKEELDAFHVFTILWNAHLDRIEKDKKDGE